MMVGFIGRRRSADYLLPQPRPSPTGEGLFGWQFGIGGLQANPIPLPRGEGIVLLRVRLADLHTPERS